MKAGEEHSEWQWNAFPLILHHLWTAWIFFFSFFFSPPRRISPDFFNYIKSVWTQILRLRDRSGNISAEIASVCSGIILIRKPACFHCSCRPWIPWVWHANIAVILEINKRCFLSMLLPWRCLFSGTQWRNCPSVPSLAQARSALVAWASGSHPVLSSFQDSEQTFKDFFFLFLPPLSKNKNYHKHSASLSKAEIQQGCAEAPRISNAFITLCSR